MWPFKSTLSKRYSKLVKLIKSIDSNFQLTENTEDSLRLHLPNYKGNQPMDFHIYLMEPQLHISFVTEIEGEKISCLNNFPKDTDQHDMFNVAMAENLKKIYQILDEKYNKNTEDNKTDTKRENNKEETKELTEEQRYALYYYVYTFTTPMYYNGNDNTPSFILRKYKNTFGLSDYDVENIINTPLYRISEHLDNLKSIDDVSTINMFLYTCVTIIDKTESGAAITNFLGIVQNLGISEEKLKDIIRTIEPIPCEHFFDRNNSGVWDNIDEDDTEEEFSKTVQSETDGDTCSDEVNSLNYFFDFDESYKKHILTIMALRPGLEFHYYMPQTYNPLWKYKGELLDSKNLNPIGCSAFVWIMQHYEEKEDFCYLLDFLGLDCMGKKYLDLFASTVYKDAEEMIYDIKRNVPSFKLSNNPQKVQPFIHQTWMDLKAIGNFIDYCSNSLDNLKGTKQSAKQLRDCSSIEDLVLLFLLESKIEIGCHSERAKDSTSSNNFDKPAIVNSWSLLDFARAHGKMRRVPSISRINSDSGEEEFSAAYCIFVHPTNKDEQGKPVITAIVAFSSELGELNPKEIITMKNELIVAELSSGKYILCKKKVDNSERKNKQEYLYMLINQCARNILDSLESNEAYDVHNSITFNELKILLAASVMDAQIEVWRDFMEQKIFNDYLSIKSVDDYDNWIESNTPGMVLEYSYITYDAITLADFEERNGQVKFFKGKINAYPYDDSFWGEFVENDGLKRRIYVHQGFPFNYNVSELFKNKDKFGIVKEKDTYNDDFVYCLMKIKKRHSMLPSYINDRISYYRTIIEEAMLNRDRTKEYSFMLYNAVTNLSLNYDDPYWGIDDMLFEDGMVIDNITGARCQYSKSSFDKFSIYLWESIIRLRQEVNDNILKE